MADNDKKHLKFKPLFGISDYMRLTACTSGVSIHCIAMSRCIGLRLRELFLKRDFLFKLNVLATPLVLFYEGMGSSIANEFSIVEDSTFIRNKTVKMSIIMATW